MNWKWLLIIILLVLAVGYYVGTGALRGLR
jgi:hypothetical protein